MVFYVPYHLEQLHQPHPLSMGGGWFSPNPWRRRGPCRPRLAFNRPADYFYVIGHPENEKKRDQTPEKDFEGELNVSNFKPEDVKVELKPEERTLLVTARHEEEEDGFQVLKSVQRTVFIPPGYDLETLKAKINEKGVLVVKADRLKRSEEPEKIEKKEESSEASEKTEVKEVEKEHEEMEVEKPSEDEQVVQVEISTDKVVNEEAKEQNGEQTQHEGDNSSNKQEVDISLAVAEAAKEVLAEEPFRCTVDVSKFSPEEISVEVTDAGRLKISATHEEVDLVDGSTSVSQMSKEFAVDTDKFDLDAMKSTLSKEGQLTVEAPVKTATEKRGTVNIPVNVL